MDPMSASVAFIGFAASLTTLAVVVVDSLKTLCHVRDRFKNVPEDIKRLCSRLREFGSLLYEVQERMRDSTSKHMCKDLGDFERAVQELKGLLAPTSHRKSLSLRIRHILQEDKFQEYQRLISSHVGTLTLLLELLNNRKLHNVSLQTTKLLEKTEAGLGFIQSRVSALSSSQNTRGKLHQDTLTSIQNHLCDLQGKFGADSSIMPRGVYFREKVVARDLKIAWTHRRSFTDLMSLGKVMSSHNSITSKESNGSIVCRSTLTFVPPTWLSRIILQWNLEIQRTLNGLPRISISLLPIRYNVSRELKIAVTNFDIPGLQRLFREGIAQPTDYIFQRRPISILEAFAARADNSDSEALAMYRYLLKEGCGNGDPLLAPSHAQVLISFAKRSQLELKNGLDSFLTYGGNILWRHSNWGSILSLIMRHGASFECLSEYLLRQPEPWTVNELLPMDRWLVGILELTDAKFCKALQNYFSMYRSLSKPSRICPDVKSIVYEVQNSCTRDRVEFLKVISKLGTRDMILPFLTAGIDMDDRSSNEQIPWLRLSYLSKATRWGNLETFQTLLDAGACPTRVLIYLSRHTNSLPPCKDPASRKGMILALASAAEPRHLEGQDEGLLSLLLRTDDVRRYCSIAADGLIDRFILPRHSIIKNGSEKLQNSYILVIIILDIPRVLEHFSRNGFQFTANDPIGKILGGKRVTIKGDLVGKYTWLTLAIHLGCATCVKLFIENGADCMRPDPCNRTALQMAIDYASGQHPRAPTEISIWPYQPVKRILSTEDDQAILAALRLAIGTQPNPINCSSNQSNMDNGIPVFISTDIPPLRISNESSIQLRLNQFLSNSRGFVVFVLHPIANLIKLIKRNYLTTRLWSTVAKLYRLTFFEALLLRIGYIASLIGLLLYMLIDLLLHLHDFIRR